MGNYEFLIQKLDEFIRKYYKNQLLRGAIYSLGLLVAFFLSLAIIEHFSRFDTGARTFLFYLWISASVAVLMKWVFIPLSKMYRLGNVISHHAASKIIGDHFQEVKDKLLNVLQLKEQSLNSDNALLVASIDQKTAELKPIPFSSAINLSDNKRYLKYAVFPVAILIAIFIVSPTMITGSAKRLVHHSEYFEREAPFKFIIENQELKAVQQEDFILNVKISGAELPEEVFIVTEKFTQKLEKNGKLQFSHLFKNIQKSMAFRLTADGYDSPLFEIEAVPNPAVLNFLVELTYPSYTGKKKEVLKNSGDLVVPVGTKATWKFFTRNTDSFRLNWNDTSYALNASDENVYTYQSRLIKNAAYSVSVKNKFLSSRDSVMYGINIIPDQYPLIDMEEHKDSTSSKLMFFKGKVADDYGFSKLSFTYKIVNDSVGESDPKMEMLAVTKGNTSDMFYYTWDLNKIDIKLGDKIEYFFTIWDNDGVSGPKSSRTELKIFKAPTEKELAETTDKNNDEIKKDLESSIKKAKELQKDLNAMNKKLLEKKTMSWEEKKKMQELIEKQKELEKQVNQLNQENKQNVAQQNEFKKMNESVAEKQEQLQQLFEKLMTPEMKELFKEMEKMLENMDKQKTQEMLEKMKLEAKDVEKELDRTLEIFKQLEVEQKFTEAKEKLEKMSKKEEELSKKASEKNADPKDLKQKQDELNKEFEDFMKQMDDLEQKNKELENPMDMKSTDPQQEGIKQEMQNSSEQLQEKKNKKASESQKKASEKMEELAQQMEQMQEQMSQEQQSEDMDALREILENLLKLSFDQEDLMKTLNKTDRNNPQYPKIAQQQKKLKDDAKMIEDSLLALSKRQAQIQSFVNKEISQINMNMEEALKNLSERQSPMAASRQQYVMTGVNNLALILSESLQQMQQQAQQQKNKPGSGSCKNPGKNQKGQGMANMRKLQEQINKQMEKMKQQGQGKQGEKTGESGQKQMSQELAKLAAQQEALRKMLQDAANQMMKEGDQGAAKDLKRMAEQMDKTETDLVNKMITNETMKRQQDILTRLLEAEKAERERDQEEKRKAEQVKNDNLSNPGDFFEYKRQKEKEAELLKTVPPSLNKFYKVKVNEYFNRVND